MNITENFHPEWLLARLNKSGPNGESESEVAEDPGGRRVRDHFSSQII